MNLKKAANAKTPGAKGAKEREMAREARDQMAPPAGDGA